MIVDSHAYCFPPGDSKAGYSNVRQHLNWIQSEHAKHHQPAWNIRDRSPAPSMDIGPQFLVHGQRCLMSTFVLTIHLVG